MRRYRRIVDWNSPEGISPDTPVCDLHDPDDTGRDGFVLFNDEERRGMAGLLRLAVSNGNLALFAEMVRLMRRRQELGAIQQERRAWHEHWWGRTMAAATAVFALGSMAASWVAILHR